jgi:hypothetical protein
MSCIYGATSKARNLTYIYIFFYEIFYLGFCFLNRAYREKYAWKTNRYNNYSFSLLIMYGSYYMFRHYIAILMERF